MKDFDFASVIRIIPGCAVLVYLENESLAHEI